MKKENWDRLVPIINATPRTTHVYAFHWGMYGTTICDPSKIYLDPETFRTVHIGDVVYSDKTMDIPESPGGRKTTFGQITEKQEFWFWLEHCNPPRGEWAKYRKLQLGLAERIEALPYETIFNKDSPVIVPEESPSATPSLPEIGQTWTLVGYNTSSAEPAKKITFREFL